MFKSFSPDLLKRAAMMMTGLALAGCSVSIGRDGTTVIPNDSILTQLAPELATPTVRPARGQAAPAAQAAPVAQAAPARSAPASPATNVLPTALNNAQPAPPDAALRVPLSGATIANGGRRAISNIGSALPIGVSRGNVDLFRSVVTQEGCNINTAALKGSVESQTGFDEDKIERIVVYLARAGEVNRGSRSYRLISGQCANA